MLILNPKAIDVSLTNAIITYVIIVLNKLNKKINLKIQI